MKRRSILRSDTWRRSSWVRRISTLLASVLFALAAGLIYCLSLGMPLSVSSRALADASRSDVLDRQLVELTRSWLSTWPDTPTRISVQAAALLARYRDEGGAISAETRSDLGMLLPMGYQQALNEEGIDGAWRFCRAWRWSGLDLLEIAPQCRAVAVELGRWGRWRRIDAASGAAHVRLRLGSPKSWVPMVIALLRYRANPYDADVLAKLLTLSGEGAVQFDGRLRDELARLDASAPARVESARAAETGVTYPGFDFDADLRPPGAALH